MAKHNIDPQFRGITLVKTPLNKRLLPSVQASMRKVAFRGNSEVSVQRISVEGPDGNQIPTHIIRPRESRGQLACLVYYHGGGFLLPAAPYQFAMAKDYAAQVGCVVVFPDYRLAPRFPFPAAPQDCYAVYQWVYKQAKTYGIDTSRVAVGGDSSGGNLAAAVSLMVRDAGETLPVFQMLVYPVTDRRMDTESARRFYDAPVWNTRNSKKMWELYLPEPSIEHVEYASLMEAPSLVGLPPAYVEVAEFDSLHDEGLAYGKRLEEAGVPVEFYETKGTPHGFEFVRRAPKTKEAIANRVRVLRSVLA